MRPINPVYSYGDTISFTADRAMLPDPDRYADALRGAFAALRARVAQQTAAPPVDAGEPVQTKRPAPRAKEKT